MSRVWGAKRRVSVWEASLEVCCISPTHCVWVGWNWLPWLRNPPGAESCCLTVHKCLTENATAMGAAQPCGGEQWWHAWGGCPAPMVSVKPRRQVLMLQQCVSIAPGRASNIRAAVGERTGRGYRLGWGGRNRGGKVSSNLIAAYRSGWQHLLELIPPLCILSCSILSGISLMRRSN